ncbi:MAG: MurR/RpiR family transcriptional regulator [Candidatus Aminicenantes bacterium]|nr:MurR/RpiR family transcriptional regulator [Candidatus Aminicenantes bacterium]
MKRNLRAEITKGMAGFSRTQKRLAGVLLDNWAEIPLLSIEGIAERAGVSTASITRLTRKLSCKGFHDFKIQVRREQLHSIVNPLERFFSLPADLGGRKPLVQAARQDVKNINLLLNSVGEETFLKLVRWLSEARRVYTYGVGISSIFSDLIAYTFSQIHKETHSLTEGHVPVEEMIFAMEKDELVIFSSFFPYSKCTIEFAQLAQQRGLRIVLLSDNEFSPLARFASLVLKVPRENILFTTSISALAVLLNAVATEIALQNKDALARELKEMERQLRRFYF